MKFRTARRLPLLLGLLLLVAPCPAPGDAAAGEVEALERELVAAIARGDLATYDRIVAEDYVAFEASGRTSTKPEILASYSSGARKYTNLEIFDVEGRAFGETAVVSAKTKGMRRDGSRDVPNRVRYIRVYARRNGSWRAVTQMSVPVSDPGETAERRSLPAGNWGGDHIGMEVTGEGARLDYDCAHGSIDEAIRLDEKGHFDVRGTHVREGPGPVRPEGLKGVPARYVGEVEGDTMKLTVSLVSSGEDVGTFTLVRGRLPRIHKCG
jgi:ketosteroid isomerase-like protein